MSDDTRPSRTAPNTLLLYDAQCSTCKILAHKFDRRTGDDVGIRSLYSEEATAMLAERYPDGWEHDYYLIEGDEWHKGARALPKVARATGLRSGAGLVRDFLALRSADDGCDCDDDHATPDRTDRQGITRRTFAGTVSAAALSLQATGVVGASDVRMPTAPTDLRVHAVTVGESADGELTAEIERRPDLIHDEHPLSDETDDSDLDPEESADDGAERVNTEEESLLTDRLDDGVERAIHRVDHTVRFSDPSEAMASAIRQQKAGGRDARLSTFHATLDGDRYAADLQVGRGPAVDADGTPVQRTSMTGTLEHDVAAPVIDFLVADLDDAPVTRHAEAYATGLRALARHYRTLDGTTSFDPDRVAGLYVDLADGVDELATGLDPDVLGDRLRPATNHVAVSGLAGHEGFAEPPANSRPDDVTGSSCDWDCGCGIGWCCGCGVGCGVCAPLPCSPCACCYLDCACGYACCI